MCRWIVRLATRNPSFNSSPRMRSAPHIRFSRAICRMSSMVSCEMRGSHRFADLERRFQNSPKPSRCQRSTVSGFTRRGVLRHCSRSELNTTTMPRSMGRNGAASPGAKRRSAVAGAARSRSAARCGCGTHLGSVRPRVELAEGPREARIPRPWRPRSDNEQTEIADPRTHTNLRPERTDLQVL